MVSTQDLHTTAQYLVAQRGAAAARAFAANGLQAITAAGMSALTPDWLALCALVEDAAMGRLSTDIPRIH